LWRLRRRRSDVKGGSGCETYNFGVVVEPDEDFDGEPSGFHACCPALEQQGASTWGATEAEALKNIDSVVHMVVQSMIEHGACLPEEPSDQVEVKVDPRVAVIV
jgi:predicted RNase H-like HicB family nuclease